MLAGEDGLCCIAAIRFFLGQVKNLNLTAILTEDNADESKSWKLLDKSTLSTLPALDPERSSRNHSLYQTISCSLATAEPC